MRPDGRLNFVITESQASTQSPQLMQAKFGPSVDAIASGLSVLAQLFSLLGRYPLLPTIVPVVDCQGLGIPDRPLKPRPGAHPRADLLPRKAREGI